MIKMLPCSLINMSTAYLLQKAGKKVVLIEAVNIGFGTTGGTTAHLSTILDATYDEVIKDFGEENAMLLAEAMREVINFIKDTSGRLSEDISFSILPAFYLAKTEEEEKTLDKILSSAKKVGMQMDYVDNNPFEVGATKVAKVENQGQLNPISYITSLTGKFQELGGILIEGCRATGLEEGDPISVNTSVSSILCRNVVYATHIPPGVNILHFRNAPYRSYVIGVKLRDGNYPKALAYDLEDPYHYYRSQKINGEEYLIVGGEDHKTGHEENTMKCFSALEEHVRKHFDVQEISFRWSSQFFEPADGLPYIGPLPGISKNVYVATGFNGDGIMLGTASA
ncbi:MAG: FAD-binding oxidoreductase, partial [Chitinophagaceae bacterium]